MPVSDELGRAIGWPDLIRGVGPQAEPGIPGLAFEGHKGCQTGFTTRQRMSAGAPRLDETSLNPDLIGVLLLLDDEVRQHPAIAIRTLPWSKRKSHATSADESFESLVCSGSGRPVCRQSSWAGVSGTRSQGADEPHLHPVIEKDGFTVDGASNGSGWARLQGTWQRCRSSLKRDARMPRHQSPNNAARERPDAHPSLTLRCASLRHRPGYGLH